MNGGRSFKGVCSDCEELFDFGLDPGECVECGKDDDGDTVYGPRVGMEPRCPEDEDWEHDTEVWNPQDGCPRCQGKLERAPTGLLAC
jgi:hypothetical protein